MCMYCKTFNVGMPFISWISRAKQNRKIKGRRYQLQAKIARNYYSILNCMVLIRQNKFKWAKIILHAKSPTFRAAKLKGFTVILFTDSQTDRNQRLHYVTNAKLATERLSHYISTKLVMHQGYEINKSITLITAKHRSLIETERERDCVIHSHLNSC